MSELLNQENDPNWKPKAYAYGVGIGALVGLIGALLYTRAAEEDAQQTGKPSRLQTGDLLGLGLALVGLVRQITELGKQPEKNRRRR